MIPDGVSREATHHGTCRDLALYGCTKLASNAASSRLLSPEGYMLSPTDMMKSGCTSAALTASRRATSVWLYAPLLPKSPICTKRAVNFCRWHVPDYAHKSIARPSSRSALRCMSWGCFHHWTGRSMSGSFLALQIRNGTALQVLTTMNLIGRSLLCFRVSSAPDRSRTAVSIAIPTALPHHASLSGCCFESANMLPCDSAASHKQFTVIFWMQALLPGQLCGAGGGPSLP